MDDTIFKLSDLASNDMEQNDTVDPYIDIDASEWENIETNELEQCINDYFDRADDTFDDDFTVKEIYNQNGVSLNEYSSNFQDTYETASDIDNNKATDYTTDGYVIHGGEYDGYTRPERLDITQSDVIESNENIIGEPLEDMKYHHKQEMPNSCAVACNEYVIKALTDIDVSEEELREVAKNFGYDDNDGTPLYQIGEIAECYGLKSEFNSPLYGDEGLNLETAMQKIANDEKLIVGVDVGMLYFPDSPKSLFADFIIPQPGHAIEITGFDTSDPNDIKVIVNDPGFADGAGNVYSWDTFRNCCADSYISIHN